MSDISVLADLPNSVLRTYTNERGDLEWRTVQLETTNDSVSDDDTIDFQINRKKQSSIVHSLKKICAFALFTIISMTIGIIVVCLAAAKHSNDVCKWTFQQTVQPLITYDTRPKHIAIGDFNDDNQIDFVIVNSGINSISILLTNDSEVFSDSVQYSTGEGSIPFWAAVGYFNNDTALDIAVANYRTNNIGIFIGNGDGTFEDQMTVSLKSSHPLALAIDDFNNDTYLDIVVISNGTFYLTLLLGDGNGSFHLDSEYYMGYDSMPCSLAVTDFNNDNRSDIVITNCGTSDIVILLATDNGTFTMNRYLTGSGSHPCSVSVGGFNNDDYVDLAIVNCGTNNIGIFLGNGDGTFTYLTNYSTGSTSRLQFIAAGFISDNDDHVDLIVANPGEDTVIVYEGNGDGSFVLKANQSTGYNSEPSSIVVGDFDNDDKVDVAVTNIGNNYLLIFTAYGYHVTATPDTYSTGDGSYPNSVGVGDLNNDSILDIVVANRYADNIGIFMGIGDGNFADQETYPTIWPDSGLSSIGVGDFNNDTYLDIAVTANELGEVEIYLGQGNGSIQYDNSLGNEFPYFFPNSLAIGDFNNDTYLDIVATNCNDDNLFVFLGNGDATFQDGESYLTEPDACPSYVSIGDFNNDSVLDFASANYDEHSVSIFIGYGNGTFEKLTTIPFNNYYPQWLVIGDLNNDTIQDIVITSSDDSSIGILLGYGNGTFQNIYGYYTHLDAITGSYTDVDAYPTSVILADLNRDKKMDIAVANAYTTDIALFFGDGKRRFSLDQSILIDGVYYLQCMATGDFNNDKQPDIVVGNTGTNDISVLLLKYQVTFNNQTNYYQGSGSHPASLTSAHLNHDQQIDIVVANTANDTIQLLIEYQNNGTFRQNITYSTGLDSHPTSVVTDDFNNDQYTDIAVVNSYNDTLMIFLLLNNGVLFRSYSYSTGTMSFPSSLAVGDLNKDGWIDIVVANNNTNNVGVFLGYNYPSFITNSISGPRRGSKPYDVIVADFNNDSECDIVVAYRQDNSIGIYLGNGNGTFADPSFNKIGISSEPVSLVTADFNDDTILDIAVANKHRNTINILLGNGDGTFAHHGFLSTGSTSTISIAVSDFDNDTKKDLVVANPDGNSIGIFFGYGNGSFEDQVVYPLDNQSSPVWVIVSDFNNDNRPDIAVSNYGTNNIAILLGYGNGSFRNTTMFSTGNNSNPRALDVGDFNKDTCIDIAVANRYDQSVGILYGDCTGRFALQVTYSTGIRSSLVSLYVQDLNNDTILDIIVSDSGAGNGYVGVLYGLKVGSFLTPKKYPTGFNSEPTSVAICDFNNDGKLDLAVTSSRKNTIDIMLQHQTEPFGEQTTYPTDNSSRPYSVAVDDFDNDDQLDIVVANFATDTVALFYGYGNGTFQDRITYPMGDDSRPIFVTTGYINNDTYIDIIVANSKANNIAILYGYANRTFRNMQRHFTGPSSAPTSVAVGYLNKDNYTDIVVTNAGINNILVFYGYGNGTFRVPELFPFSYGDNPTSATLGDYNNDSVLDIAVANHGPGYVEVLLQVCDD